MPYCPKCGKPLPDKALFCPSCGEKVPNSTSVTPAPSTPQANSSLAGPSPSGSETTAPTTSPDKNGGFTKQMNMSLQCVLFGSVALLVATVYHLSGNSLTWLPLVFLGIGGVTIIYGIVTFFTYPNKHVFSLEEMPQLAKPGQTPLSPTEAKGLSWKAKMGLAYRSKSTIVWTAVAALALVGAGSFAISSFAGGQIVGYYDANGVLGDMFESYSFDVKLEQDGTVLRYRYSVDSGYSTVVSGTGTWTYQNQELTITLDSSWEKNAFEDDNSLSTTYVQSTENPGGFWDLKNPAGRTTYCWNGPNPEYWATIK